jgi:hypothetical protein
MISGKTAGARQVSMVQEAGPYKRRLFTWRMPYSPEMIARIRIWAILNVWTYN